MSWLCNGLAGMLIGIIVSNFALAVAIIWKADIV